MRHPSGREQLEAEIELDESDLEEVDPRELGPAGRAVGRRGAFDTLDEPLISAQEVTLTRPRRSVPPPLPPSIARRTVPPPPSLGRASVPPPPARSVRPPLPSSRAMPPPRARRAS